MKLIMPLISMKKSILLISLSLLLQSCAMTWDVIELPPYVKPYKVYSSPEIVSRWNEVAAGSVLVENSQVFLSSEQKLGLTYGGPGLYVLTPSMDVDELDVTHDDATLSIKFDKMIAKEIDRYTETFQSVSQKDEANIVIVPFANLFGIGNGYSNFELKLEVRYIDPVSKKKIKKYFSWVDDNAKKLNGPESWSAQGAKSLILEAQKVIPFLVEVFFTDLDQRAGALMDVERAKRVYIQTPVMHKPEKMIVINEKQEYISAYQATGDKPIRYRINVFPKTKIVESR